MAYFRNARTVSFPSFDRFVKGCCGNGRAAGVVPKLRARIGNCFVAGFAVPLTAGGAIGRAKVAVVVAGRAGGADRSGACFCSVDTIAGTSAPLTGVNDSWLLMSR